MTTHTAPTRLSILRLLLQRSSSIALAIAAISVMVVLSGALTSESESGNPAMWLMGIASVLGGVAAIVEARHANEMRGQVADHEARIRVLESHLH